MHHGDYSHQLKVKYGISGTLEENMITSTPPARHVILKKNKFESGVAQ
jgi:hypothetical protein